MLYPYFWQLWMTWIVLWMIETVTIAARQVTVCPRGTTPHPSPTPHCTSTQWAQGTSRVRWIHAQTPCTVWSLTTGTTMLAGILRVYETD